MVSSTGGVRKTSYLLPDPGFRVLHSSRKGGCELGSSHCDQTFRDSTHSAGSHKITKLRVNLRAPVGARRPSMYTVLPSFSHVLLVRQANGSVVWLRVHCNPRVHTLIG